MQKEAAETNGNDSKIRLENGKPPRKRHLPLWVLAIVAILVIAGIYGGYEYFQSQTNCSKSQTIVIDVYDSFMAYGAHPNASRSAVFQGFANATGIPYRCVTVNYLSEDVANLISSSPTAQLPDIAIGLTEVTAEALGLQGLLQPYAPPGLAQVAPTLVNGISPENYATPYEWQYLGTDYMTNFDNQTGHALTQGDLFQPLASNTTLAKNFLYENPTTDSLGKEFLLWEYQFYTSVLHQNWTTFWQSAKPNLPPAAPSWGTGISEFGPTGYPAFVSFGTDPAYYATYPQGFSMNSTFSLYQGTNYAWKTIYGASIVRGNVHNLGLDEEFLNWLLSGNVQDLIPLNEWMYPANETVGLPPVYSANPPVQNLVALNGFTSPRAIAQNLTGLLLQWQNIMG